MSPRFRSSAPLMMTALPAGPRTGMTLIEILAVVVILGLLAVTLTVGLSAKIGRAKHEIARTQIAQIVGQIEAFQLEKRRVPSSSEGLAILSQAPSAIYYLSPDSLNDPWGNPYRYAVPGPNGMPFEVSTLGADGQAGGDGDNADLSSASLGKAGS